jgi:hypothetical protein
MTKSQAQILESIAALPEDERRALVGHLVSAHFDRPSFLKSMTPEQRARLDASIAEADRGELIDAATVWDRLKVKFS